MIEKNADDWFEECRELTATIAKLEERQQEHLRLIQNLSQSTPLDDEVSNALAQRGVLLAEIGTLKQRSVAIYSAWFGIPGVMTPEIMAAEKAKHVALEERAREAEDREKRLVTKLRDLYKLVAHRESLEEEQDALELELETSQRELFELAKEQS